MDPAEYWRLQVESTAQEYDVILQSQRDEIQRLQRRCSELLHERSMMKAATAEDVRGFCLNYQANQQQRNGLCTSSAVTEIPVQVLMSFLHEYSNGLVPQPENVRKRGRGTSAATIHPHHHRLYQRMITRQRQTGREDEMEEWILQQQQQAVAVTAAADPQAGGVAVSGGGGHPQQGEAAGDGAGGPVMTASAFGLPLPGP